jgi:hypothetical protein
MHIATTLLEVLAVGVALDIRTGWNMKDVQTIMSAVIPVSNHFSTSRQIGI